MHYVFLPIWSSLGASKISVEIAAVPSVSLIKVHPRLCAHGLWCVLWWWLIPPVVSYAVVMNVSFLILGVSVTK
jgi:hypothetical protein